MTFTTANSNARKHQGNKQRNNRWGGSVGLFDGWEG